MSTGSGSAGDVGNGAATPPNIAPDTYAYIKHQDISNQNIDKFKTQLINSIRSECELWHGIDYGSEVGYISLKTADHFENIEINSHKARRWLVQYARTHFDRIISSTEIDTVLLALEGISIYECNRFPLYYRLADTGSRIYVDLCNDAWEVICITAKGWDVIPGNAAPVKFKRVAGALALPRPASGGSLSDLGKLLHIDYKGLALCAAWLVNVIISRGVTSILLFSGSHGSSKSVTSRTIKRIIDPKIDELIKVSRSDEELAIKLQTTLIVAFDNMSKIPPSFSDTLCRITTGTSFSARKHHTNTEEIIFTAKRPILLNSIVDVVQRPDLLNRTITVVLDNIDEIHRVTEDEYWEKFSTIHPMILGGLFDAVSLAIKNWGKPFPDKLPRLADFYKVAYCCGDLLPGGWDTFKEAWSSVISTAERTAIEHSGFGETLLYLLRDRRGWGSSANDLLKELKKSMNNAHGTPSSPQALVAALRRLSPVLESYGWRVEFGLRDSSSSKRSRIVLIQPKP